MKTPAATVIWGNRLRNRFGPHCSFEVVWSADDGDVDRFVFRKGFRGRGVSTVKAARPSRSRCSRRV